MEYVVGLITDATKILLIEKNRPDWQKGNFNGIGGKIEENETSLDAMIRETKEETGLSIYDWRRLSTVSFSSGDVLFIYATMITTEQLNKYKSLTDEKLSLFNLVDLPENLIEDTRYYINNNLISMIYNTCSKVSVVGVDNKIHLASPWSSKCDCGVKIRSKYLSKVHNDLLDCYECTY